MVTLKRRLQMREEMWFVRSKLLCFHDRSYKMANPSRTSISPNTWVYICTKLPHPLPLQLCSPIRTHTPLPGPRLPLLINPDTINKPIRLRKSTRHKLHMRITSRRHTRATRCRPHIVGTSPLSTERGIEDHIHVLEMLIDIAAACEFRERRSPSAWVGGEGSNVRGDAGAGKEPDGDCIGGPFSSIDAAADGVEAGAEVVSRFRPDSAASVFSLVGRIDVAVSRIDCSCHARV